MMERESNKIYDIFIFFFFAFLNISTLCLYLCIAAVCCLQKKIHLLPLHKQRELLKDSKQFLKPTTIDDGKYFCRQESLFYS